MLAYQKNIFNKYKCNNNLLSVCIILLDIIIYTNNLIKLELFLKLY